mmetsp:Transcript_32743/g.74787  ORF Transcript_32743/g.74787 Transcript_32743/m.74787 type:complete len:263 (-) Transcript_32743:102-890(-)
MVGDEQLRGQNHTEGHLSVLGVKRRASTQHLIDENTKTPPIDFLAVPSLRQDLWSQVLGGSHKSVDHGSFLKVLFAEAKVREANMTVIGKEDVFWLQVSVDITETVQAFQREHHLGCIKPSSSLGEFFLPRQMIEEVTSTEIIHDQVQLPTGLEGTMQVHHEGVLDIGHNISFSRGVLHFLIFDHVVFVNCLHRENLSAQLFPHHHHLSKTTVTNDFQQLKVVHGQSCDRNTILVSCVDFAIVEDQVHIFQTSVRRRNSRSA